jgi:hypothetical protein
MRSVVFALLFIMACAAAISAEPATDSLQKTARALAQEFVGLLKPQLKRALADGGPSNAISVCADVAPGIATSLSTQSGWTVERVSLNSRNASRAIPDSWEHNVLLEFDRRQRAGEEASSISFGQVVGGQYRYMQAQGVEPLCLTCHGKGLADTTVETLQEYYPDDMATGYSLGQVRGAISLSKSL